jgi:stage IV sporulation protein FB
VKVGRVLSIQVILNDYFLLLLVLFALLGLLPQACLLFGIVIAHELGHVVVARGYRLNVVSVELLPFGGVARIGDFLEVHPGVERAVALAGPLTNAFLVVLAYVVRVYVDLPQEWFGFFVQANLTLGAFNCVPALPLDGGRILRSYLVGRIGFRRATERAADIGRVLAVLFAVAGAVGLYLRYVNLSLIILAFFVFVAAGREKNNAIYVFTRYLARKRREVSEQGAVAVEGLVASNEMPVKEVVKHFVPRRYHLIYLLTEDGDICSFVTEREVIEALLNRSIETPLGDLPAHQLK